MSVVPEIPACMKVVRDLYGSTNAGPNFSTEKSYPQILQLVRSSISCSVLLVRQMKLRVERYYYQSWTHSAHLDLLAEMTRHGKEHIPKEYMISGLWFFSYRLIPHTHLPPSPIRPIRSTSKGQLHEAGAKSHTE